MKLHNILLTLVVLCSLYICEVQGDQNATKTSSKQGKLPANAKQIPKEEKNISTKDKYHKTSEKDTKSPTSQTSNEYTYHIIPHTHDDAGWLTSFENYYTGTETPYKECVECILDKVLELLTSKESRVFPYVEISFFERWYSVQTKDTQKKVKDLVQKNQLYFSNAGWVMNDEACVYYEDVIEQFILGHRFVFNEFNYTPTVGWSIDPFGHSSTQPYLLAQMGINVAIFERINHKDVEKRKLDGTMEFVWLPDENFPEWNLIGHHNYMKYGTTRESGYCFPKNICDEFDKSGNNIPTAAEWLQSQASMYGTKEILWQIGNDFTFSYNGTELYEAIEEFVEGVNNMSDPLFGRAILSTPEIYTKMWYDDYRNLSSSHLVVKNDDFFPYAEVPSWTREAGYWSGYFTSKPKLKWAVKDSSWLLQTGKKVMLGSLLRASQSDERERLSKKANEALDKLERALAINQHHDAITGTAKKFTDFDYMHMLNEGRSAVWESVREIFENETIAKPELSLDKDPKIHFFRCNHNTSSIECKPLSKLLKSDSNTSLLVKIYNPGNNKRIVHRIKVPHSQIEAHEIVCAEDDYTNSKEPDCDLYINDFFPSYESRYYLVKRAEQAKDTLSEVLLGKSEEKTIELPFGSFFKILKDKKTYKYKFCDAFEACIEDEFALDYKYYDSVRVAQQSGAYIMRLESPYKHTLANSIACSVFQGKYVTIIKIARNVTVRGTDFYYNGKHQIVTKLRLNNYDLTRGIEIDTYLDAIRVNPAKLELVGIEISLIIQNFRVRNQGVFRTDSNGLRMMTRTTDYHTDYPPDGTGHQVESSYYPVTAAIILEDTENNLLLSVVNDRSQGGSSLNSGEIEIMIQRRTSRDDARGVGEALMDTDIVTDYSSNKSRITADRLRTTHFYQLSDSNVKNTFRARQIDQDTQLLASYAAVPLDPFTKQASKMIEFNKKIEAFPPSVKVSARAYLPSEIILRLVNLNDVETVNVTLVEKDGSIPILSYLSGMKSQIKDAKIEELSLNTIMTKKQVLSRKFELHEVGKIDIDALLVKDFSNFRMRPLELLTFRISNFSIAPFTIDQNNYYSYEFFPVVQENSVADYISLVQNVANFEFNKSSETPKNRGQDQGAKSDSGKSPNPTKKGGKKGQQINDEIIEAVNQYNYLMLALKVLGVIAVIGLIIFIAIRVLKPRPSHTEFEEHHQDDERKIPSPSPEEFDWQGASQQVQQKEFHAEKLDTE